MKNQTTYNRSVHNSDNPYTPISSELINNPSLSAEEKYLLIFLLSKSDDYILNSSYLADNSKEFFDWGKGKFYKIWMGLQEKGFIIKEINRNDGKVNGVHYTINESLSIFNSQNPKNQESGKTGIQKTKTLLSNNKPTINKHINKKHIKSTNLKGDSVSSTDKNNDTQIYLKRNPDKLDLFLNDIFSDEIVADIIDELIEGEERKLFEFIITQVSQLYPKAQYWNPSEEDLEYCEVMIGSREYIADKLRDGVKSAFNNDDWRFGQIVYQAVAAVNNREELYGSK